MRLLTATLAALALGALPAAARDVHRSPDLWATVNICDTPAHPDRIGIRGSMPGLGDRTSRLWMRIGVQYLSRADGAWHDTDRDLGSGWQPLGPARARVKTMGWTVHFLPPRGGGAHTLRGVVSFKWTRGGRVVERARRLTRAGHPTRQADPPGFSRASCRIS